MAKLTLRHTELVAGDRIVDGPEVEGTRRAGDGALRLVNPHGQSEWWLYPDSGDQWVVERPDPPRMTMADLGTDSIDEAARRVVGLVPRRKATPQRDPITDPQVGDVVLIWMQTYYRPGIVARVGRKNLRVTYATPHGVKYGTVSPREMSTDVPKGLAWPVPRASEIR
jgi:hypothetical protein